MPDLDHRAYWEGAFTWDAYLADEVRKLRPLWEGVWRKASVTPEAVKRAASLGGPWRVLVISEDWCGDASNTLPAIARLAEAAPSIDLRVVKRDENPELMDRYLTGESRSIPLAIVLDANFRPAGRWGPRPSELQAFVTREKAAGEKTEEEIYRQVRGWYARDRGETAAREILAVIAAAAEGRDG